MCVGQVMLEWIETSRPEVLAPGAGEEAAWTAGKKERLVRGGTELQTAAAFN